MARRAAIVTCIILISLLASLLAVQRANAADTASGQGVQVAVALSLSSEEEIYSRTVLEGLQPAVEEANATTGRPHIDLKFYDDKGLDERGAEVARQIVADAALVLTPRLGDTGENVDAIAAAVAMFVSESGTR